MKIKFLLVLITITLLTNACIKYVTTPKQINCPLPEEPLCQPNTWNGMPYDSSYEVNKFLDNYYKFEKVQQINTIDNEWCLSFLDNKFATLMFDDNKRQKAMIVRMITYNKGKLESGIGIAQTGHIGTITAKNNTIIYSVTPTTDMIGRAKLYEGTLINNNYIKDSKPIKELSQNEYTWEAHPSLSNDGRVIFFASDRFPNYGGTDIYFSIKLRDNSWTEPINCGPLINTGCNEITPFITNNGKYLLFSSNGHETVGGYDIFSIEIKDSFWKALQNDDLPSLMDIQSHFINLKNLKPPLNTKYDELFPSTPVDIDSLLYYSSNQDKDKASLISMEGGFDIFVRKKIVKIPDLVKKQKKETDIQFPDVEVKLDEKPKEIDISLTYKYIGTVFEKVTMEEIPEADVTVKKLPEKLIYKELKTDKIGKFEVELQKNTTYDIIAETEGMFFDSKQIYVDLLDTTTVITETFEVPIVYTLRINFPTDVFNEPYKFVLDENGIETTITWQEELDNLAENILKSIKKLNKIILVGHTDDVGSLAYNFNLAKKRVEFIIDELIKRGIPKEKLEGKSAGETEPLKQLEGEDLEMFRKRLRRVELKRIY